MSTSSKLLASKELDSFAKAYKEQGGKVVGTYCCHLPEELLHAANILPYRLRATGCKDDSGAETYLSSFSCSFVRAGASLVTACLMSALAISSGFNSGL